MIDPQAIIFPVQSNADFLALTETAKAELRAKGWKFYTFIGGGARFMFAWDASPTAVEQLCADIAALMVADAEAVPA